MWGMVESTYSLHYGKSTKALAEVIPDNEYLGMWRIRWPDGQLSDMVNLSRAKDAACVLAMRNIDNGRSSLLHWTKEHSAEPLGRLLVESAG
jgi:hypothetical protein